MSKMPHIYYINSKELSRDEWKNIERELRKIKNLLNDFYGGEFHKIQDIKNSVENLNSYVELIHTGGEEIK